MNLAQKWVVGLLGLGALYLAFSNPKGVTAAGSAVRNVVGGTESDIISGGKTVGK